MLHSQMAHQVAANKLQRGGLRKRRSKRLLYQRVQSGCGQELGPFRGERQPRKHKLRVNQLARVGLQGEQDGGSAQFLRDRNGSLH